ncbi:7-carboxy-7-deazaguanine synthase QueE [Roseimaritima sediminicola]|uniref:7-carboxy-7-deazaguanine synthase QueE n=1 Tax=Roseimaritima sediminicola TaxID=2662066 RepID=UPI001F1BB900|nr:7-carboxy-7-deazaguanine synthase QueE [Roseimaritima sediminicola]
MTETFDSRQGEGKLTGTQSHFIRLAGCNLRCWFCDTPYASWAPEGDSESIDRIIERMERSECRHVVLTGGEPLMFKQVTELAERIRRTGRHLTIETAGTLAPPITADLMSISPKLASSGPEHGCQDAATMPVEMAPDQLARWQTMHEQRRFAPQAIASLIADSVDYQIKFVLDTPADTAETLELIRQIDVAADHVWIMPQGVTVDQLRQQARWLQPWCRQHGFHYCDRMHIHWYGNRRGT